MVAPAAEFGGSTSDSRIPKPIDKAFPRGILMFSRVGWADSDAEPGTSKNEKTKKSFNWEKSVRSQPLLKALVDIPWYVPFKDSSF